MEDQTRGVHISSGDGIVAHVKNLTAYASGEERRINELLVRLNALAGAPWQEIVRTLTADIAEADYDDHPRLACVSVEPDRVAALVFGDTSLSITIDGSETVLDGRDSSTWIDVAIHGSVERIHAGTQSESAVVGVLRDGVIPAGGFLLDTSGPIPASGRWSEMAHAAAEEAATVAAVAASADVDSEAEAVVEALQEASTPEPLPIREKVEAAPIESASTEDVADSNNDEASNEQVIGEAQADDQDDAQVADQIADATEPIPAEAETEAPAVSAAPAARGMFARIEQLGRPESGVDSEAAADGERPFGASPFTPTAEPATSNGDSGSQVDATASSQAVATLTDRNQIRGVLCVADHITAPNETTCRTCGQSVPSNAQVVTGTRPALGMLTFDDGAALTIDRPAAIGANVPSGYLIDGEPATIVRLDDGVGGVSAVQLEVRLSGWDVEIVDMQSTNGTYTMLRGERQTRTKLRAGQSVTLQPGMTVETGGRSFMFAVGTATF